jgi:outer membrane protein assembly factor BamD
MIRRILTSALTLWVLFCLLLGAADAQLATQKTSIHQPDSMLFQQAQAALKKSNYAQARSLLETLINTHPDSDYVPRAKLSIADSWFSERAYKQAELEYRDFITFFPNRPEVAVAQRRIDSIHKQATF